MVYIDNSMINSWFLATEKGIYPRHKTDDNADLVGIDESLDSGKNITDRLIENYFLSFFRPKPWV